MSRDLLILEPPNSIEYSPPKQLVQCLTDVLLQVLKDGVVKSCFALAVVEQADPSEHLTAVNSNQKVV